MPQRTYHSPFTGDAWADVRPAIGTIIGLAHHLNARRPRRKPPEGCDAAIALAMEAAGAIAGVPRITRVGEIVGRRISDAYWQAKEARQRLTPIVDDGVFLQEHRWFGRDRFCRSSQACQGLPARLAWQAAFLVEKASTGDVVLEAHSSGDDVIQSVSAELRGVVDQNTAARVERTWRFTVAAGRTPVSPQDDELLAAFEAALMAKADDFADHLARNGWG